MSCENKLLEFVKDIITLYQLIFLINLFYFLFINLKLKKEFIFFYFIFHFNYFLSQNIDEVLQRHHISEC